MLVRKAALLAMCVGAAALSIPTPQKLVRKWAGVDDVFSRIEKIQKQIDDVNAFVAKMKKSGAGFLARI
jgi:hypothetical protein